jgi:hypothetical protein
MKKMKSYSHLWTDEWLLAQRQESDDYADEVVKGIIDRDEIGKAHEIFRDLITNKHVDYKKLPPEYRTYFENALELPEYADTTLIELGEEVFRKHGPAMTMLLMFKSLPQSYACADGVQVLFATGRLRTEKGLEPFKRRLMETAQFVINVMSEGGLKPGGKGILTALKVRLIHATIRQFLLEKGWDSETLGDPLNQEDKAGTLMAFSALVLEGMEQLNIVLTPEEKEAYTHCWSVIGHFMGVKRELIPANAEEADRLGNLIFDQQMKYSKEGQDLAQALLEFLHDIMPGKHGKTPEIMMHYLLGNRVANALGLKIKLSLWELIVEWFLKTFFKHRDKQYKHVPNIIKVGEKLKMLLLQGSVIHWNDHKEVMFYIPPSLQEDWDL